MYRGPFVYGRSAGGRITSAGVQYYVTDHLGSVVAVVKGSDGTVVEAGKYVDFGHRTDIVAAILVRVLKENVPGLQKS